FLTIILAATLSLAACGGGSAGAQPVEVKVTETDFKIDAAMSTFKVGVPYRFVVTNSGAVAHQFEIMPVLTGTVTPDDVKKNALAGISETDLIPGATKTLDYTFTQAADSGKLEFACQVPGHYAIGMHQPISVGQ
ncbi:MAG TPA: hypothetical protein VF498_16690, partial [Anaerolineales bacterium]